MKYQRSTPISGCEDVGIRKAEFVAKTEFICFGTSFIETITKIVNKDRNLHGQSRTGFLVNFYIIYVTKNVHKSYPRKLIFISIFLKKKKNGLTINNV